MTTKTAKALVLAGVLVAAAAGTSLHSSLPTSAAPMPAMAQPFAAVPAAGTRPEPAKHAAPQAAQAAGDVRHTSGKPAAGPAAAPAAR